MPADASIRSVRPSEVLCLLRAEVDDVVVGALLRRFLLLDVRRMDADAVACDDAAAVCPLPCLA